MRRLRLWPVLPFLLSAWLHATSTGGDVSSDRFRLWLAGREQSIFTLVVHKSRFADIPLSSVRQRCEDTQPPEALATPNPVLAPPADQPVVVTFIVGIDGSVQSPLILEGGGPEEDRMVLGMIHHWRYRPATCNGVPMEAEAKVEFSRR
jgi:TonB-like protein